MQLEPEPLTSYTAHLDSILNPNWSDPEFTNLEEIIEELQSKYITNANAFTVVNVAGGYQLVSRSEYEIFIRRLLKKSGRLALTNASLETLAIVAYRQPVNRFEI